MNLTKYVQDLCEENYKTLLSEIKEELNKWRGNPHSRIGRLNILKMSLLPNTMYRFNPVSIKIPASYFVDTDKLIPKFTWRDKRPRIANTILKENKFGGLTLPDFKIYYKATGIKTVWHWQNDGQIDQWNRIKNSEIDPHKYSQLIFDKGAKAIQ